LASACWLVAVSLACAESLPVIVFSAMFSAMYYARSQALHSAGQPDSRCACSERPLLLTPTQFYVWRQLSVCASQAPSGLQGRRSCPCLHGGLHRVQPGRHCYPLEGLLQAALTRACCVSDSARRAQLLEAVRALKPACTSAEGFSVEALHAALQQRGYIVELKHTGDCAARSVGRRCLENLHHTYVVCRGSLAGAVTVGPAPGHAG